jgi:hypothetical protein
MSAIAFARCPHTPEDAAILARTDPECWTRVLDRSEGYYMAAVLQCPTDNISTHHLHLATLGVRGDDWHALAADIVRGAA